MKSNKERGVELARELNLQPDTWVVRLWDMFDGWIDITGDVSREEADRIWNEKTSNGTQKTSYSDGDYYKIFPSDTKMLFTPEYLGR